MGYIGHRAIRHLLVAITALAAINVGTVFAQTVQISLPEQSLSQSLKDLARQSGSNILFTQDSVKGIRAPELHGQLTVAEAIAKLLAATDLEAAPDGNGGLIVRRKSAGPEKIEVTQHPAPELTEVVVTGTHIAGVPPVGSQIDTYTRDDLEESGAVTLDQFARDLPGNFSNADLISNVNSNTSKFAVVPGDSNAYFGAGFNLRGLGASSTLTLVNGHRMASGGDSGGFVDSSLIPVSAIDHIDILTDGASAIYGADAVGGVVNIVTRKDFSGAETSLRYAGATSGGDQQYLAAQALGHSWSSGNVFLNYEFNTDGGLDASQRDYIDRQGEPTLLIPKDHRESVFLSADQELSDNTKISGTGIYTDRQYSSVGTVDSSIADFSTPQGGGTKMYAATVGVDHSFSNDMHFSVTGNYSTVRQALHQLTYFVSPALPSISSAATTRTQSPSVDALLDGRLFSLPAGDLKTAIGASYLYDGYNANSTYSSADLHRNVDSMFGEIYAPLVGPSNALPFIQRLDLSIAGRYDRYSDFGSTTNPKLGLRWTPIKGLDFNGSYGKSFRAPLLSEVGYPQTSSTSITANPLSPSGTTDLLTIGGGNTDLKPQKATIFSAGFDLRPTEYPEISLSAHYFNIDYHDQIATPAVQFATLFTNPVLAPFLTLNPTLAQVDALFNSPGFQGDFATGPDGKPLGPAGVGAILDDRSANIASTKQSGIDWRAGYTLPTIIGQFGVSISVDQLLDMKIQPIAGVAYSELLNTFAEPVKWKGRGAFSWSQGPLQSSIIVNYTSGYQDSVLTPSVPISSWTTEDFYLRYKSGEAAPVRNLTVALNVNNLTNTRPPYVLISSIYLLPGQNPIPFDAANASPVGRLVSILVSKQW